MLCVVRVECCVCHVSCVVHVECCVCCVMCSMYMLSVVCVMCYMYKRGPGFRTVGSSTLHDHRSAKHLFLFIPGVLKASGLA